MGALFNLNATIYYFFLDFLTFLEANIACLIAKRFLVFRERFDLICRFTPVALLPIVDIIIDK